MFIDIGWVCGDLYIDQCVCVIDIVYCDLCDDDEVLLILFGFIDLYVYGGVGVDIMQGGDSVCIVVWVYVCYGIMVMLGIIMIVYEDDIVQVLQGLVGVIGMWVLGMVWVLGVYLEGFFISVEWFGV